MITNITEGWKFFGDSLNPEEIEQKALIIKCSECGNISFCGEYGSYHCRHCKVHNGDHDLIVYDLLNLNKIETINRFEL